MKSAREPHKTILPLPLALLCGAALAHAAGFTLESRHKPDPRVVDEAAVEVVVGAPSPASLATLSLRLNGREVARPPASGKTSLAGPVSGLVPGENHIEVFPSRRSRQAAAHLTVVRTVDLRMACEDLAGKTIDAARIALPTRGASITSAHVAGSGTSLYCAAEGAIAPVDPTASPIRFAVFAPMKWSLRIWHLGGGLAGTLATPPPLPGQPPEVASPVQHGDVLYLGGAGTATAVEWALQRESWLDFAYEQIKKTHDAATATVSLLYGVAPRSSYFAGEGEGGRQALEAVSRYSADYDGVLAVSPFAYYTGQLLDSALRHPAGLPPAQAVAVRDRILRLCDSLDGAADGVINNYTACNSRLDPSVTPNPLAALRCPGSGTGACLSGGQLAAVNAFHSQRPIGFPLANGESDWPGWGTGLEASGAWPLAANAVPDELGLALLRARLGPSLEVLANLPAIKDKIQALSDQIDPRDDWTGFLARHRKLMLITAASDYVANPRAQMRLYERVVAHHGRASVDGSVRYYVAPNADHTMSGSSANGDILPATVDYAAYLVNWVERGVAPEALEQTSREFDPPYAVRASRPLCRYPAYPRYKGTSPPKLAAGYTCAAP